ncbi:MAG TPA: EAL domain-containing protein [Bosea sp. (in: a-proteobacteria)]|uniref:sensor domain-containing phosphodiesterase n=1 Tax=Bosea sp. (in: a-proteobacteria) TaxID=1871050 RepID=UPI002E10DCDE|nr:EAL domain-containing protein [Bosea sp. (in: a-proteobacteria)]
MTISPHVAQNIDRILQAVRSHLKMDVAFVSEFLGKNRIFRNVDSTSRNFPLKAGDVIPMAAGYCQHVVSGRLPELIPDTDAVAFARQIPETQSIPIGAHLSVPIGLDDGHVFGTFCCFSHAANLDLKERDLEMLRTFGRVVANDIAVDLKADRERRETIERIDAAIEAGDPHIVFQPIVRLTDLSVAGVECLARFDQEPVRSPDKWFASAHAVGMGELLELLAVRKALEAAAALPADHVIGINISPLTLIGGNVAEALSGFDPQRIVIEITEHTPIEDYDAILHALAPLRQMGIRVAIDDAGAGYSSLRHILAMRPDVIKFDVSLTRNVDSDPVRKAMAAALVEFARRTGTEVVAEGVETQAEFDALRSLKFDKAQGYFLGRPRALRELLADLGLKPPRC